jgi:predicted transcriptional regulator
MTMTTLELAIIEASLNYLDRAAQLSDNYSNYDADHIAQREGITAQAVGGATASLITKGYMFEDEGMVWITDEGVNAYFDQIEAEA